METLPIDSHRDEIKALMRSNQVVILAAETGAGKSTKVPLMLSNMPEFSGGLIGVTQPRRVAATAVAERVAELAGTEIGDRVGYQIKGVNKTSNRTAVKFMTEGILLRELHGDSLLSRYSVVVVDEAHERGINQDLLLALLKQVLKKRSDLRVLVMSATINEQAFADYFAGAPVLRVPGRMFPVEERYLDKNVSLFETCLGAINPAAYLADYVCSLLKSRVEGDILCFLPDEHTIKIACDLLQRDAITRDCRILPLYGAQAPEDQRRVFERGGGRRIIVATNIAETSVTIDGVRHVVDSGLIKTNTYVRAGMSMLTVVAHSRAGCDQRKGRAGRTAPGVVHRLYTHEQFLGMFPSTKPEILRMSLEQVLLHLMVTGYSFDEVLAMDFMDPPSTSSWFDARESLEILGALSTKGVVTDDGFKLERFPVAPVFGRMLLEADKRECVAEVALAISAMNARSMWLRPKEREAQADAAHAAIRASAPKDSDSLVAAHVFRLWASQKNPSAWAQANFVSHRVMQGIRKEANDLVDAAEKAGLRVNSKDADPSQVREAIASGLLVNFATASGMKNAYHAHRQVNGVYIHPSSSCFHSADRIKQFVFNEIVTTTRPFARGVEAVSVETLKRIVPADKLTLNVVLSHYEQEVVTSYKGVTLTRERLDEVYELANRGRKLDLVSCVISELATIVNRTFFSSMPPVWAPECKRFQARRDKMVYADRGPSNHELHAWTALEIARKLAERTELPTATAADLRAALSQLSLEDSPIWEAAPDAEAREAMRALIERGEKADSEYQQALDADEAKRKQEKLARFRVLEERARALSDNSILRELHALDARTLMEYQLLRYQQRLDDAERQERRHDEQTELMINAVPSCPLCGLPWTRKYNLVYCPYHDSVRDGKRVYPRYNAVLLTVGAPGLGVLASVRLEDSEVLFDMSSAWFNLTSAPPLQVYKTALVAPMDCDVESFHRDLNELTVAMRQLAQVEQLRKKTANAIELTFGENGRAVVGRTTYAAEYDAATGLWPESGERWVVQQLKSLEGANGIEVKVKVVARVGTSKADVDSLRELAAEFWPFAREWIASMEQV